MYIPLGGSRAIKIKHYRNLLITFSVSGLWHDADWSFLMWEGYMESYRSCIKNTKLYLINSRFINVLRIVYTYV